jgi:hypothetical protein
MSHYSVIDTRIASGEHLVKALRDMGFEEVEVHTRPQPLLGWMGDSRTSGANIIVRREHIGPCSNDIGFLQTPSGYFKAQISDFDSVIFGAKWLRALTQRYAYHVAADMLEQRGFSKVDETRGRDGTVRLTVRRMA